MIWGKLAAAGNFFCAAWAIFLAYGLFLGEARQFLPAWSDGQLTSLAFGLLAYTILLVALSGLLIRGMALGGILATLLHLVIGAVGVVMIDPKSSDDILRSLPRTIFQLVVVLLNVKAAFALTKHHRDERLRRGARGDQEMSRA